MIVTVGITEVRIVAKNHKPLEKYLILFGLIFTIISAVLCAVLSFEAFLDEETYIRMLPHLYDCGLDSMCTAISAALFFGCMKEKGEGADSFRIMTVMSNACCLLNFFMYYLYELPENIGSILVTVLLIKLINLVLIFFFYWYVRVTLSFKGKLASLTDRLLPVVMAVEVLILLSNLLGPVTFRIDASGAYAPTEIFMIEDIFRFTASVLSVILIALSKNPPNQKAAALTFIFFPLLGYAMVEGEFGDASPLGLYLISLIVIYCIIFHSRSRKLAATQVELNMAAEIQASVLPSTFPAFPDREEFDLYASMVPAREVGGDFYDFFMIDDDHLGIVIADVSDKGVPAALFMMTSKTVIQNYVKLGISAAEALYKTNDALCYQNKTNMFVTAWIGILELSTGKLNCSSAGHEFPAICHGGKYELFEDMHGLVLGAMEGTPYKDYELTLNAGDKIFVYTDGIPEATSENNKLYGMDQMIDALNTNPSATPKETIDFVRASVDRFVGTAEQFDDLTMVCLEYKGSAVPSQG